MRRFSDLDAWNKGLKLLEEIYRLTRNFPSEEKFELTSQVRRAAKSILANLAEGCGRFTYADRAGKFVISRGECFEVEAFMRMAIRLGYVEQKDAQVALELSQSVGELLSGLISSARKEE